MSAIADHLLKGHPTCLVVSGVDEDFIYNLEEAWYVRNISVIIHVSWLYEQHATPNTLKDHSLSFRVKDP